MVAAAFGFLAEALANALLALAVFALVPAWLASRERGVSLREELFGDED